MLSAARATLGISWKSRKACWPWQALMAEFQAMRS